MNLKSLWNSAVNFVRKLPVAQYIKPLWKGGLKFGVQEGLDEAQEACKAEVRKDLAAALPRLNAIIDKLQDRAAAVVSKVPMPAALREKALHAIREDVDELQAKLPGALDAGATGAVCAAIDKLFDSTQAKLIARIDAL